jgi:hypothetical protein
MKEISVMLVFSFLISCSAENKIGKQEKTIFDIEFQEGFIDDTVCMYFADQELFKNVVMKSSRILGFTGHHLVILQHRKSMSFEHNKSIRIIDIKAAAIIEFTFTINKTRQKIKIDTSKGKYIGFNKGESDTLITFHRIEPFMHD